MYVVPENIHTPTTEGIGNSEGEGGSKTQEIPEGRGGGGYFTGQKMEIPGRGKGLT